MYISVRKHALHKTPYLPNNISYASAVYLGRHITCTVLFLVRLTYRFGAFFNPKNASEANATNNTPLT